MSYIVLLTTITANEHEVYCSLTLVAVNGYELCC